MTEPFEQLVAAIASSRQIDLPRYMRVVEGHEELVSELDVVLTALGVESPLYVSGTSQSKAVCSDLEVPHTSYTTIADNTRAEVTRVAERLATGGHDAAIAVGGGRPVDVAKAACLLADVPAIVLPTQLSTDGIASPIAVIRENSGDTVSERSQLPTAVIADLQTIAAAPPSFARAGLGDLIGNRTAIADWRIAAAAGEAEVDDFAALLASAAHLLVEGLDLTGLRAGNLTTDFARRLLDGLVLSGLAMEIAGSSRPCSGSEHLISHALDQLHPGTASHGEQVAFGTIVATALQGGDALAVKDLLRGAGMTGALTGFGIGAERLAEVIKFAPATRPDRYTVLDRDRPTAKYLRGLITELLEL